MKPSTLTTGNGFCLRIDPWHLLTLYVQGKIDDVDLRIIEAIAVQRMGKRKAARIVSIPEATLRRRLSKMAHHFS